MKKLFTILAAALFSVSMMADVAVLSWYMGEDGAAASSANSITGASGCDAEGFTIAITGNAGKSWSNGNGDITYNAKTYKTLKNSNGAQNTITLPANTVATAVTFYVTANADSDAKLSEFNGSSCDDAVTSHKNYTSPTVIAKEFATPVSSFTFTFSTKQVCFIAVVTYQPSCEDPELTVSPTEGTGYVGDPIDITVSSKNQSKPINPAVTVDGEAAVYGTDYTFSASIGLVQATPLKAGTFVITFTQASNGTYCDAEESATFVISEKSPVTSFEIEGPTSARVGDEITLTATNFDAAATNIWWTDKYGTTLSSTAEYTFTPEAEGDVVLTAWAENEFNESSPVNLEHTVSVTIGHNAYLSDLKVNGTTIEGFDDEKFEYDLGEIGVYEPVEVTAIPADDPYATATVNPGNNNVLITVFAQDKTTYNSYTITYTRKAATELASISDDTTWDWANAGSATAEFTNETLPTKTEEFNFADVLISPAESFNAAALVGIAQFANRGTYFQGNKVKFNTTVNGYVSIYYQNTSNRSEDGRRWVVVNGTKVGDGAIDQQDWYLAQANVSAGDDVVITFIDKSDVATMLRINKIVFTKGWPTAVDNAEDGTKAVKFIENGQMFIKKNGVVYNAQGAIVK